MIITDTQSHAWAKAVLLVWLFQWDLSECSWGDGGCDGVGWMDDDGSIYTRWYCLKYSL